MRITLTTHELLELAREDSAKNEDLRILREQNEKHWTVREELATENRQLLSKLEAERLRLTPAVQHIASPPGWTFDNNQDKEFMTRLVMGASREDKIRVIRVIRTMTNGGLAECKGFVEASNPKMLEVP